jgi:hypothetical protein
LEGDGFHTTGVWFYHRQRFICTGVFFWLEISQESRVRARLRMEEKIRNIEKGTEIKGGERNSDHGGGNGSEDEVRNGLK